MYYKSGSFLTQDGTTAAFVSILERREEIAGFATVKVGLFNEDLKPKKVLLDSEEEVLVTKWITSKIPDGLLISYRKVITGAASKQLVDVIDEFILNSPEAIGGL